MFDGTKWWARREVKADKETPPGFVAIEIDHLTRKTVGWEPVEQSGFAKFIEGVEGAPDAEPGTYELCGPRINANPEDFGSHVLVRHGAIELERAPREFKELRDYLNLHSFEGIVWHHPDGRMAKLKRRDFPR